MPKGASLEQRVRWHLAHAKSCGCREIPGSVVAELRRRGIAVRKRSAPTETGRGKPAV